MALCPLLCFFCAHDSSLHILIFAPRFLNSASTSKSPWSPIKSTSCISYSATISLNQFTICHSGIFRFKPLQFLWCNLRFVALPTLTVGCKMEPGAVKLLAYNLLGHSIGGGEVSLQTATSLKTPGSPLVTLTLLD